MSERDQAHGFPSDSAPGAEGQGPQEGAEREPDWIDALIRLADMIPDDDVDRAAKRIAGLDDHSIDLADVASTCYWETDPPTYVDVGAERSARLDDLKGLILRWRQHDGETGFEARLHRDSLLTSYGVEPEYLYRGPSVRDAVAALNLRLDRLEQEEGFVPSPRNKLPKRLDPDALIVQPPEAEPIVDPEPQERRGGSGPSGQGTPKS